MTAAAPTPRVSPNWHDTLGTSLRIGGAALAAIATVATAVAIAAAPGTRHRLDFPFTGLPRTAGEAFAIFIHNLRALGGVAGLILIAQIASREQAHHLPVRALRGAGECLVCGIIAANVLVVGAALGAYGPRMVGAVLPHAPVELAAYALALGLYTQARRTPYPPRDAIAILAISTGLLAVAAGLEVFAAP